MPQLRQGRPILRPVIPSPALGRQEPVFLLPRRCPRPDARLLRSPGVHLVKEQPALRGRLACPTGRRARAGPVPAILFTVQAASLDEAWQQFLASAKGAERVFSVVKTETEIYLA